MAKWNIEVYSRTARGQIENVFDGDDIGCAIGVAENTKGYEFTMARRA